MEYKLTNRSFFPFLKLFKALNLKSELKELAKKAQGKTQEELIELDEEQGFDYIYTILEKAADCEKEFFNFLKSYTGKNQKEIEEMSPAETFDIIKQLFSDPLFKSFFQQAAK